MSSKNFVELTQPSGPKHPGALSFTREEKLALAGRVSKGESVPEAFHPEDGTAAAFPADRMPPPPAANPRWPWRFKVCVLGRFQVLKDDAPICTSRRIQRKPLELLQALIAFGGTGVGAHVLTEALWPDSEGDAGYHALESALYRLRQLLSSHNAVTMLGSKLTLDRRQFWVDLWELQRELRPAPGVGAEEWVARLRALYEGQFLEHESEKPWALKTRQALHAKLVRSIRDAAHTCETRGLWDEAARLYQAGLEVDSLAEDLHRGLIVCHRELGNHAEALRAYRICRELLAKLLGVQPNAKTLAAYQTARQSAATYTARVAPLYAAAD
jgi:LuxR family maltose regulon positive regulatory protein